MAVKNIILIDKSLMVGELFAATLEQMDIKFFYYQDDTCWHFIEDIKPQLLFIDCSTAVEFEQSFIKNLQNRNPSIKIIALKNEKQTLENLPFKIKDCLKKPLGVQDLIDLVQLEFKNNL